MIERPRPRSLIRRRPVRLVLPQRAATELSEPAPLLAGHQPSTTPWPALQLRSAVAGRAPRFAARNGSVTAPMEDAERDDRPNAFDLAAASDRRLGRFTADVTTRSRKLRTRSEPFDDIRHDSESTDPNDGASSLLERLSDAI